MASRPRGPAFLGVGPEKTGTSWINEHLSAHPRVWTHPVGELRYFWENWHFGQEGRLRRYLSDGNWHHKQYRLYGKRTLKMLLKSPGRLLAPDSQLRRDMTYLLGAHDDDWYLRQFPHPFPGLAGEISPQYFFLPEEQIARMARFLPNCRIIISLRDPVGWIWSFARMVMKNGGFDTYGTLEAFVAARYAKGTYSGAVRNWRKHFGERRVAILFYDDLCADPWAYYTRICAFLAVEPDPERKALVSRKINSGQDRDIDPDMVRFIRQTARDDLEALAADGVAVPASWLA